MDTEQMQALHNELWQFRREMEPVWPTPNRMDSLRFAFTEAGEAMDAYLRTKPEYARNNQKQPDLYGELADCAMMLMTALGPEWKYSNWFYAPYGIHLEDIGEQVAVAMTRGIVAANDRAEGFKGLVYYWQSDVQEALRFIAFYPGMDLPAELRKRMARIREKHGKKE